MKRHTTACKTLKQMLVNNIIQNNLRKRNIGLKKPLRFMFPHKDASYTDLRFERDVGHEQERDNLFSNIFMFCPYVPKQLTLVVKCLKRHLGCLILDCQKK